MKIDMSPSLHQQTGISAKTIDVTSNHSLEQQNAPKRRVPRHAQIQIEDFSESEAQSLFEVIRPYLKDLYNDLNVRCIETDAISEKMIDKITFIDYTRLPVVIAERLFSIYDKSKSGLMSEQVFSTCMFRVFGSEFQVRSRIIFQL